jgi:hypothetical protein
MSFWTTFFSVYTGVFFTLSNLAVRAEFDNLNDKLNSLQRDNRELNQELKLINENLKNQSFSNFF